jgi:diguanylate cyclase (GGDEF)-like protein
MRDFFLSQMDYVFFLYGLAFLLLGAACLTVRSVAFPRLPWGWLASFAFVHGASEWLDLILLSFERNQNLLAIKTIAMIASFAFLLQFALSGFHQLNKRSSLGFTLAALLLSLVASAGAWGGLLWFDVAARYLLGLPGGLLAAMLIYRARRSSRAGARPWLLALAAMMALYALLAGAVVPPSDLFLSQLMDYPRFLEITGIPVQVCRALVASAMAVVLWIGSEVPGTKTEQIPFHYALGLVAVMLILIPGGWALTEGLSRQTHDDIAKRGNRQARALARIVDKDTERINQAAHFLAVNSAIRNLAVNPSEATLQSANQVLDQIVIAFQLQVAYILDRSGTAIASSNRNSPESIVTANYAFRPYFQSAVNGHDRTYLALGVTSNILGQYSSAPVQDAHGKVVLVVVLKSVLPSLASAALEVNDCLLLSPVGLVLDACDQHADLHSLWPLGEQQTRTLIESRQFGPGPFPPLIEAKPESGQVLRWRNQNTIYIDEPLSIMGWSVALFLPLKEARIYRLFGIGVTLVMSLLAIGFYILLNAQEVYAVRLGVLMLQLRDQAHTDPLTRLANRGWFQESFSRELKKATRLNQNLALIMFDIDHFKKINDRFGHQAGDRALVKLAETARLAIRDYDLISRWGGEEFVALLPDTDLETARLIAERLREQIAATDLPEIGQVTCSFGVVERRNNENGDSLINRADAALYQAKDAGRNRVICA